MKAGYAIVDTDGVFTYECKKYSVSEFEQYAATETTGGDKLYCMDRVLVVDKGLTLELYDQSIFFLKEVAK